jgi:NhaA family Na+:H+ antiporter
MDSSAGGEKRLTNPLQRRFEKFTSPFDAFVRNEISGGVILVLATIAALWLANSPFREIYHVLGNVEFGLYTGDWRLSKSLHHWVNDGLMALFFFVLGLEIKRELLAGGLRDPKQSILVIMAALGGMMAPAAIFVALNVGDDTLRGWAIPMATDTAFAIGALALLGKRVPRAATVFLVALAIVDDIGAILVIVLFYTETLVLEALGAAVILLALLVLFNVLGLRRPAPYVLVSALLWLAILNSGVHATLAGVLAALAVPARPRVEPHWFIERMHRLLRRFEEAKQSEQTILEDGRQHMVVEDVEHVARLTTTPLQRWERALEKPVTLFVVPIFSSSLSLGVAAGLLFGKVIGITSMSWLGMRFGFGQLPHTMGMRHVVGIGLLAGMGFTMSIFIATLGFSSTPALLLDAKMGILTATFLSGTAGMAWLWFFANHKQRDLREL